MHEHEILVRVEEELEEVHQDYQNRLTWQEKRGKDWVRHIEEEKYGRIKELEKSLVANGRSWEILSIHAGELQKEAHRL